MDTKRIIIVSALIVAIGFFGFEGCVNAVDYYMPDDCADFHTCFVLMAGGDTLIIRDGVYTGVENSIDWQHRPPNGNESNYTIIKAEHQGEVIFDGENIREMASIRGGSWSDHVSYVEFNGLVWRKCTEDLVNILFCDHIKLIRCGAYDVTGDGYLHNAFNVNADSHYVLLEECWSYGNANYNFIVGKESEKIILRRCVVRHDRYDLYSSPSSFAVYGSNEVKIQNCIAIDAGPREFNTGAGGEPYSPYTWMFRHLVENDLTDISIIGSISLNNEACIGVCGSTVSSVADILFNNSIIHWGASYGSRTRSDGADFNHCVTGQINSDNSFWGSGMAFEVNSNEIDNSIIFNVSQTGIVGGNGNSDYNCLFSNSNNYQGIISSSHDYCSENSNEVDPLDGYPGNGVPALKYLLRIEDGSNLDGTASDGGDIGATILYKTGRVGTLWGEEGWNGTTNESLWPFPNEDFLKEQFGGYSYTDQRGTINGDRGFCADGNGLYGGPITLTSYIWEYLGSPCPPEICDYAPAYHQADLNDDGVISMPELMAYIARWKLNDGVSKAEVLDAGDIWFSGGVY